MKEILVPLVKQEKLECGPTVLSGVLQYFGKMISPAEITRNIGGIKKYGVRTIKLADYARDLGFKIHCYSYNKKLSKGKAKLRRPNKEDIIKFLKKKIPVIIAVRAFILFNEEPSDMGHFIVVTKYQKGIFFYKDPVDGKLHKIKENDLMFALYNNALDSSAYFLVIEPKS